jgi:hypothetical protein
MTMRSAEVEVVVKVQLDKIAKQNCAAFVTLAAELRKMGLRECAAVTLDAAEEWRTLAAREGRRVQCQKQRE